MASQEDLMARKLGLSPLELNGASISEPVILLEQGKNAQVSRWVECVRNL